jgi:hypothetical protein
MFRSTTAILCLVSASASTTILRGTQSIEGTATKHMEFIKQSAKAQAQAGEMCDLVSGL